MDLPGSNKPHHSELEPAVVDAFPLAYVKAVTSKKGENGFAVFSGDGTQLAVFDTEEAAFFAARQHELEPVHIH